MIYFSQSEIKFIQKLEECRIATSHDDIPHVKPVSYLFNEDTFLIATDYNTRMYKNLLKNPRVAMTIDIYKLGNNQAIVIQGKATIIESGKEFLKIYENFFKKFEWVRKDPWGENEAPFIKITTTQKASWGIE